MVSIRPLQSWEAKKDFGCWGALMEFAAGSSNRPPPDRRSSRRQASQSFLFPAPGVRPCREIDGKSTRWVGHGSLVLDAVSRSAFQARGTRAGNSDVRTAANASSSKSRNDRPRKSRNLPPRRRRRPSAFLVPGSVAAGVLLVAILFAWDRVSHRDTQPDHVALPAAAGASGVRADGGPVVEHNHAKASAEARLSKSASRKRPGEPIPMLLVPDGAWILVHLRPSALWRPASRGRELGRCLPPLAAWTKRQIIQWCLFPPDQVEEVLFSLLLTEPGAPLDVAATVWLKEAIKEPDLAQEVWRQTAEQRKPADLH